jgi:hypothetical protein
MRHFALSSLVLVAALPAAAQDRSLWDLVHPDRLAASMVRSGVLALRSQMDLRYSNLSVSVAEGALSLDDLEITLYDNITDGAVCDVSVGAMEVLGGDPFDASHVALTVSARSVTLQPDCIPPEAAPLREVARRGGLFLPEVVIDLDYDVPSAGLRARASTGVTGIAAVALEVEFDYATLWAGAEEEPEPSGDLRSATLTVENLGGWDVVRGFLPPPFVDPERAGDAVAGMLSGILAAQAEGGTLAEPAEAFVTEVSQGWQAFLAKPDRLVIETGFAPTEPLFLDPETFEQGPLELIEQFRPVVRQAPAAERTALAPELVAQALSVPDSLPAEQRRAVGLALLTGEGAPRAVQRGLSLLSSLDQRDGEVMLAIAEALAGPAPADAYGAALLAGRDAAPGARAMLDRLEREIDFVTRIRIQDSNAPTPSPTDLNAPVRELAARAQSHFSGMGAVRSLRAAMLYASLAAARGDGGAARLLDRIDRAVPEGEAQNWAGLEAEVAEVALGAWTGGGR